MLRRFALVALAGASLLAIAGPVDAARGGNGNGNKGGGNTEAGSTVFELNEAAPIVHGQAITFTVSTTEADRPFSSVQCYQSGVMVYSSTRGHFQDYYDYFGEPVHYLSSLGWPTGDADCTASLLYQARNGRTRSLTSFGFSVAG